MKINIEMPNFFMEMLNNQYEEKIVSKIIEGYVAERKLTFRANTLKTTSKKIEEVLLANKIQFQKPKWSMEAFIIEKENKKQIENLEIYKNGEIYMQSLSSMLPPIILEPRENCDILDMTAAPGGKTTQIAALTNNKANITACEINNIRMERLKYNIEKQGARSVYTMQIDSRKIDNFFAFDQILLDAPCSRKWNFELK